MVIGGSLFCWLLGLLFHKLFENVTASLGFLEIFFVAALGPFLLGLIVSLFTKNRKSWLYGGLSYLLYFFWIFILSPLFEMHFSLENFARHLVTMTEIYIVLGGVSVLFAAFGGFLGNLGRRRLS